jgi:hypothetical protein
MHRKVWSRNINEKYLGDTTEVNTETELGKQCIFLDYIRHTQDATPEDATVFCHLINFLWLLRFFFVLLDKTALAHTKIRGNQPPVLWHQYLNPKQRKRRGNQFANKV